MDAKWVATDEDDFTDFCVKLAAAMLVCTDRVRKLFPSKDEGVEAIADVGMRVQFVLKGEPEEVQLIVLNSLLELHVRRLTDGTPTIRPVETPKRVQ